MGAIITTESLCRDFKIGDGSIVSALKNVNIEIEKGKLTILRGRSGSGKTTLINILGALDKPTKGKVLFDGRDITALSERKRDELRRYEMSFVFQSVALMSGMNAYENVEFGLRLSKTPYGERDKRVRDVMRSVGLEKRMFHRPSEMSGGEQQRVAIARALAKNPKLLLCDEPTGALDYNTGKQILKLLQDTSRRTGMTVIIITHNQALTAMADRIIRVKSGTIYSEEINPSPAPVEDIEW